MIQLLKAMGKNPLVQAVLAATFSVSVIGFIIIWVASAQPEASQRYQLKPSAEFYCYGEYYARLCREHQLELLTAILAELRSLNQ